MTFSEYAAKSISTQRVLLEIDIMITNEQWINCGAGLWKCNADNDYPEVSSDLLDGFFALNFISIGSVRSENSLLTKLTSISDLSINTNVFYFDSVEKTIYIHLENNDEPFIHLVKIGILYGFSYDEFSPSNSNIFFEGRLTSNIVITIDRDLLYYGKIHYNFSNFSLINADGEYDLLPENNNIYGNEVRIRYGFEEIDYGDYVLLYSALLEKISVSETNIKFTLTDKRKQLSVPVQYVCTNKNALDAIVEILELYYNIPYNSNYYNVTEWDAATVLVPDITIDMVTADEEKSAINLIQDICSTVFGLFIIQPNNKYSFKLLTDDTIVGTIESDDILNDPIISYDPTEILTSTKIGYDKNWTPGYTSPYTFLIDTTQEETIFEKYQTYKQKIFYTLLTNLTDAQTFSDYILNYWDTIRGITDIKVPMKYYTFEVGYFVNCNIKRRNGEWMGLRKCEVLSKKYNLLNNYIDFKLRLGDEV